MKIVVGFPPLRRKYATLGGNRQFQYFKDPTYIYPTLSAQLATKLQAEGHEVYWEDGIAEDLTLPLWIAKVKAHHPKLIYLESKYAVHNEIAEYKQFFDCPVDVFGESMPSTYPMMNKLPLAWDYDLTKWWLYSEKNGNFSRLPGTYIMSARDCWWGKCKFCSWAQIFKKYEVRDVYSVTDEISRLHNYYGIREIMDDSGTFPTGKWLRQFCREMMAHNNWSRDKVRINCNMRFGVLSAKDYEVMAMAGFRMVLFGLESANQSTLDRIDKGVKVDNIIGELKTVARAGLQAHIAVMFGFPNEGDNEDRKTYKLVKYLLTRGLATSVQATTYTPYPNTPEYDGRRNLDMSEHNKWVERTYRIAYHPAFLFHRVKAIRSIGDILYYLRIAKKVGGHVRKNANFA